MSRPPRVRIVLSVCLFLFLSLALIVTVTAAPTFGSSLLAAAGRNTVSSSSSSRSSSYDLLESPPPGATSPFGPTISSTTREQTKEQEKEKEEVKEKEKAEEREKDNSSIEVDDVRDHPHSSVVGSSGSVGTLVVILSALGILFCVAASYVVYLRYWLGIRSHDSVWMDLAHLKSTLNLDPADRYQPVGSSTGGGGGGHSYPHMPISAYPIAYPPNGAIDLADVGTIRQQQQHHQPPQQSHQHQHQATHQQSHQPLVPARGGLQTKEPMYSVDADDLEYYSDEEE